VVEGKPVKPVVEGKPEKPVVRPLVGIPKPKPLVVGSKFKLVVGTPVKPENPVRPAKGLVMGTCCWERVA